MATNTPEGDNQHSKSSGTGTKKAPGQAGQKDGGSKTDTGAKPASGGKSGAAGARAK